MKLRWIDAVAVAGAAIAGLGLYYHPEEWLPEWGWIPGILVYFILIRAFLSVVTTSPDGAKEER